MAGLSKLPISQPFPSLGKSQNLVVPKLRVVFIKKQRHSADIFEPIKVQEIPKQGSSAINRAKKIIKNPLTFYRIK